MSINRNIANTNSSNALNTIQTAADTLFINSVDGQIATAITLGQFQMTAMAATNVNLNTVFNYYANLGYAVSFPDYLQQNGIAILSNQTSNYFGWNWVQYWQNTLSLNGVRPPARMTICWGPADSSITGAPNVTPGIRILNSSNNTIIQTDSHLLVDTTDAAAGSIFLPAGINGASFTLSGVMGGPYTYTVTPSGSDTMDVGAPVLIGAGSNVTYTFLNGVWYAS